MNQPARTYPYGYMVGWKYRRLKKSLMAWVEWVASDYGMTSEPSQPKEKNDGEYCGVSFVSVLRRHGLPQVYAERTRWVRVKDNKLSPFPNSNNFAIYKWRKEV